MINTDVFPADIRQRRAFVLWKLKEVDGKTRKIPYGKDGAPAKVNDPSTWTDYETARRALNRSPRLWNGIGLMLDGLGVVCIDLDDCLDGGEREDFARGIVERLDSYTEISNSGKGLHVFMRGHWSGAGCKNTRKGIEVYAQKRYIATTGDVFEGHKEWRENQEALDALAAEFFPQKGAPAAAANLAAAAVLSVDEIIEKARVSGDFMFSELFDNAEDPCGGRYCRPDGTLDDSAADLALMDLLPFWTNGDRERMREIFSHSVRGQREKWKSRADYQDRLIGKALQDWNGRAYDPHYRSVGAIAFPDLLGLGTKNPRPDAKSSRNIEAVMQSISASCRWNSIRHTIELTLDNKAARSLDVGESLIMEHCRRSGLLTTAADVHTALEVIADRNRYNPATDFLKACRGAWDGHTGHIRELFQCFKLDTGTEQDPEFLDSLFTKWLMQAVVMAFNDDGRQAAQGVLTLRGAQGIGKSRFLQVLLPGALADSLGRAGCTLDPANRDSVQQATSAWITELAEFGGTMRRERLSQLKGFLTSPSDKYRAAYARNPTAYPRRTCFFATINDDRFLKDDTGNRRYWPVALSGIDQFTGDIRQVWGEAFHLAREERRPFYLDKKEIDKLTAAQEQYRSYLSEEQVILDSLDWDAPKNRWHQATATQLCKALGIDLKRASVVGRALATLAKEGRVEKHANHMRGRWYRIPPFSDAALETLFDDSLSTDTGRDILADLW